MESRNNMKITPVDKKNLDGQFGATAVPVDWPKDLSARALQMVLYLDDTAALFLYQGKYIMTDESGWLTDSEPEDRICGGPRAEFSSLDEVGPWLEGAADDFETYGGGELPKVYLEE